MKEISEFTPVTLDDDIAYQLYDSLDDLNEKVITSIS